MSGRRRADRGASLRALSPAGLAGRGGALLLAAGLAAAALSACGGPGAGGDTGGEGAAATERYYVRVDPSADPRAVAARHGVEPIAVVSEEHAVAFYAALTRGQAESLRADSLVVSLAREIHQGGDTLLPRPRGVTPADTGDA